MKWTYICSSNEQRQKEKDTLSEEKDVRIIFPNLYGEKSWKK